MGDEGLQELETLGVLRLLSRYALPRHHLSLPPAPPPTLLHRKRHHPLHAVLLPHWACVLPAHRLW